MTVTMWKSFYILCHITTTVSYTHLIGLALAFNAGIHGGYQIAYICAIIGSIANSFLDTGIYPAVSEIIYKAPGVATMGIKFFIAIAPVSYTHLDVYKRQILPSSRGFSSFFRTIFHSPNQLCAMRKAVIIKHTNGAACT